MEQKMKKKTPGGANTNLNGLSYEKLTDLKTNYTVLFSHKLYESISFSGCDDVFIQASKTNLFNYMNKKIDKTITHAHGCKQPDECYINERTCTIIIIEKKFQTCPGSICEKIQTYDFKIWQYKRLFPNYKIIYAYCLSDWFKNNCPAELEYLNLKNVPVFWGDDKDYKTKMVDFIISQ
jgi:hypothetical protein